MNTTAVKIEILTTITLNEIREKIRKELNLEEIILEVNEEKREMFEVLWAIINNTSPKAHTSRGLVKIFLIPNEKEILFKEWINKFGSLIIVVDSEKQDKAEEFLNELNRKYTIDETEPFKYRYNFVLVETDNIFTVGKLLYNYKIPTIWIVGRKKDIEPLKNKLKEYGLTDVDDATIKTQEDLKRKAQRGDHIIVYLNSRISKGIDLPEYNAVIVYSYNFAVPDGIFEKEVAWEIWQTILRITPCGWQNDYEKLKPKLIIFPKGKILKCPYADFTILKKNIRFFKNLSYFFSIISNSSYENLETGKKTGIQGDSFGNFLYNRKRTTKTTSKNALIVKYAVIMTLFNEIRKKDFLIKKFPEIAEHLRRLEFKKLKKEEAKNILFEITRDKELVSTILRILDDKRILMDRYSRTLNFGSFEVELEQIGKKGHLTGNIRSDLPLIQLSR